MLLEDITAIKSTRKDLRNFGLTVGIVLCLIAGVLWWVGRSSYPYLLIPGAALILCGLVVPAILKPIQKVWMTIAVIMGWIMTRVILSLLFFLVFTPMAVAARLLGKHFLLLKWKSADQSYWNHREREAYDKKRSEMQF